VLGQGRLGPAHSGGALYLTLLGRSSQSTERPTPIATTPPTGANQFATEAQAEGRCPSDIVVWANTKSKVYHFSGYKNNGETKEGAYMFERDAQSIRRVTTKKTAPAAVPPGLRG
jgi:hypothetical protein